MALLISQVFLLAVYVLVHVLIAIVAVHFGLWLQGSVEWLIDRVNASPDDIDKRFPKA